MFRWPQIANWNASPAHKTETEKIGFKIFFYFLLELFFLLSNQVNSSHGAFNAVLFESFLLVPTCEIGREKVTVKNVWPAIQVTRPLPSRQVMSLTGKNLPFSMLYLSVVNNAGPVKRHFPIIVLLRIRFRRMNLRDISISSTANR
jgi:hypothetical protein